MKYSFSYHGFFMRFTPFIFIDSNMLLINILEFRKQIRIFFSFLTFQMKTRLYNKVCISFF